MYHHEYGLYLDSKSKTILDFYNGEVLSLSSDYFNMLLKILNSENITDKNSTYHELFDYLSNRCTDIKPIFDITTVKINVSNTCNMSCKYCYADSGHYGREESVMTKDIALNIFKYIDYNFPNIKQIVFFGGEPLLNLEVIELVCNYFIEKNIKYGMITNLSILNAKVIDILTKFDISLTVSLDGPKVIHDMHRCFKNGEASYDIVSRNLKKVKDLVKVELIEVTYSKLSQEKYSKKEIREYIFKEFDIKNVYVCDVESDDEQLKLDLAYQKSKIENVALEVNDFFNSIMSNEEVSVEHNQVMLCVLSLFSKNRTHSFCNSGFVSMLFDDKGDIWPCQVYIGDNNYKLGNINEELLNTSVLKLIKKEQEKNMETCGICNARFWCQRCHLSGFEIDEEECEYKRKITDLVIEQLLKVINDGKFVLFNQKLKENIGGQK